MIGTILCGMVCILCLLVGILLLAAGFVYTDFFGDKLQDNYCGYTLFTAGALLLTAYIAILWIG